VVRIAANKRAYLVGRELPTTNRRGSSKRTWDIQPSKLISLLREFVTDKKPLLNILHEMDKELLEDTITAWSLYIENGGISFLEALRPELQSATQQKVGSHHLVLDTVCRLLIKKMEAQVVAQNASSEFRLMHNDESWETYTNQSFQITALVLKESRTAEVRRKTTGRYSKRRLRTLQKRKCRHTLTMGLKVCPTEATE
jgi:hypothetical protein